MMPYAAMGALSFPEFSPAIVEIGGFPLRWYALAYIVGLVLAWRYAVSLVKRPRLFGGMSPATSEDIDDLLFYATLGVILGGRLGYILFYQLPFEPERVAADPMMLLRVWEGGMSFHGGLIGVALALFWVARKRGVKLLAIGDIAGVVTPIGLFFGRLANFINAELYGRHTDGAMGMVFPEARVGGAPGAYDWTEKTWIYCRDVLEAGQRGLYGCTTAEMPRHPSQLYEAALEGLIPFLILSIGAWWFGFLKRPGLAAGLFLILYGLGRSIAEQFREPDAHIGLLPFGITMGFLLSLPMWIGGAWLVWQSLRGGRTQLAK
ncbi:MAG: prolipoprotein diacylglyceryl transferase [Hyphomonadaceae bacterium]|nr:prolipoprotein diacylglyceryl transferase [Hyphomonadaceae bacterium]